MRLFAANMNINDSGANRAEHAVLICARNHSGTEVAFQINQVASTSPTATRTQLGSMFDVVSRGDTTQVVYPTQPYLELKGIFGNGIVRLQIESRLMYSRMAFAKTDYVFPLTLLTLPAGLPSFDSLNTGTGNVT